MSEHPSQSGSVQRGKALGLICIHGRMRSRWRVLSRGVRPAAFLQPSRWPLRGQVQEATLEPPVQVQREAVVAGHTQEGRTEGSPPLGPPSLLCSPSLAIHIRDSGTRVQERDMGTCRKQGIAGCNQASCLPPSGDHRGGAGCAPPRQPTAAAGTACGAAVGAARPASSDAWIQHPALGVHHVIFNTLRVCNT